MCDYTEFVLLATHSYLLRTFYLLQCCSFPAQYQMHTAGKFSPQFFPKLVGIQLLFSKTITAASLWVHLLSINLFTARTAYVQGGRCSSTCNMSVFV